MCDVVLLVRLMFVRCVDDDGFDICVTGSDLDYQNYLNAKLEKMRLQLLLLLGGSAAEGDNDVEI